MEIHYQAKVRLEGDPDGLDFNCFCEDIVFTHHEPTLKYYMKEFLIGYISMDAKLKAFEEYSKDKRAKILDISKKFSI